MQILATSLQNCPILNIQSSRIVGVVKKPIVDPKTLKIVAFSVDLKGLKPQLYLLANAAMISSPNLVTIRHDSDLSVSEDLVRNADQIKSNISLFNFQTITQARRKLGRVEDYRFENETFLITKLHIKANPLQRIWIENRIIDRRDIVEVTHNKVIIRDNLSKNQIRLKTTLPAKNS